MMDFNCQSYPTPSPLLRSGALATGDAPSLSKNQIIDRRHTSKGQPQQPPMRVTRHRSSGSCYSQQSLLSNATGSSTRTHRRNSVEVSSFLFGTQSRCSEQRAYAAAAAERDARNNAYCSKTTPVPLDLRRLGRRRVGPENCRSVHHSPERRAPSDSDQVLSARSHCSRVKVSSGSESRESGESEWRQRSLGAGSACPKVNLEADPALRAMELIRALSFDTSSVPRSRGTSVSDPKNTPCSDERPAASSSALNYEDSDGDGDAVHETVAFQMEASEPPPPPPPPPPAGCMSPPLPPKINRMVSSYPMDVPHQVLQNRNRTRSTSVSEMSESYFDEFVCDVDDSRSYSTCSSLNEEITPIEKKPLVTIENDVPSAPILLPGPPVSLWSRGRTVSCASDQSSYVSSASSCSDDLSAESQGSTGENEDQGLGNDENQCLKQGIGHSSLRGGKSWNHAPSQRTIASDMSSFVSSASSSSNSSDELGIDSRGRVEERENLGYVVVPDRCPNHETGHSSLQEGKCNTYEGDSNAETSNLNTTRLTSGALREWNAICQEEYAPKRGIAKNRFIFRALSCPSGMCAAASSERGHICMDSPERHREAAEEPVHLMDVVSQSLFSYTNSGYSPAASTISSQDDNDDDDSEEAASDLDFDMAFIYSHSIEKSSIGTAPIDGAVDRLNKSHRTRSFTLSIEKNSSVGTPLSNRHRRSRSSGSRLGKPLAMPKLAMVIQEDALLMKNNVPPRRLHRRFKSDGSIFCKTRAPLSQIDDFGSTDNEPSFKGKCSSGAHRHHRGKSLDFKEPQIIDCSPLQSILEVLEEASKGSHGSEGPTRDGISSLVDFVKRRLENLSPAQVLTVGFLLGSVFGLLMPYIFAVFL